MKSYSILFLLPLFLFINTFSQNSNWLFESAIERDSVLWQWGEQQLSFGNKINFYYPAYSSWKPSKFYALEGLKFENHIEASFKLNKGLFMKVDSNIIFLTKGKPCIKTEIFAQDINKIKVKIRIMPSDIWINMIDSKIETDYPFQPAITMPITEKDIQTVLIKQKEISSDTFYISDIKVEADIQSNQSRLVIGNIYLIDKFSDRRKFANFLDNYYKTDWNPDI
jgi:hypothetical protein